MSEILQMIPNCLMVSAPLSLFIALVSLGLARAKMKTVAKANQAYNYLDGDLDLYQSDDMYINQSERLVSSERNNNNQ